MDQGFVLNDVFTVFNFSQTISGATGNTGDTDWVSFATAAQQLNCVCLAQKAESITNGKRKHFSTDEGENINCDVFSANMSKL